MPPPSLSGMDPSNPQPNSGTVLADLLHAGELNLAFLPTAVAGESDFKQDGRFLPHKRWIAYRASGAGLAAYGGQTDHLYKFGYFLSSHGSSHAHVLCLTRSHGANNPLVNYVPYANMHQYKRDATPSYLLAIDDKVEASRKQGVRGNAINRLILRLFVPHRLDRVVATNKSPIRASQWVKTSTQHLPRPQARGVPNKVSTGHIHTIQSTYTYVKSDGTSTPIDSDSAATAFYVAKLPFWLKGTAKYVALPVSVGIMKQYHIIDDGNVLVSRGLCNTTVFTSAAAAANQCATDNKSMITCYVSSDDYAADEGPFHVAVRVVSTTNSQSEEYRKTAKNARRAFGEASTSPIYCACLDADPDAQHTRFVATPNIGSDIVAQNGDTLIELTATTARPPSTHGEVVSPLDKTYTAAILGSRQTNPVSYSGIPQLFQGMATGTVRRTRNVFVFSDVYASLRHSDQRLLNSKYQVYVFRGYQADTGVHHVSK